jgi:hypothetical protein
MPNVVRGSRVGGLLRYLYGPGKREEHVNPRLVAAWDGAGSPADLEPMVNRSGKRDVRHLTELLEIPIRAGRNPPRKVVWHCSLRSHRSDRTLSDEQWRHIAGEVMAQVGLAPHGDDRAVRWVAVRHADDHIHLVATLVRQDRRTSWARNDYPLSQAACRDIEQRYGLYRVGAPGQGSRSWPRPAELNKAARQRQPVAPREELRRRVRAAATIAVDEADFFERLRSTGIEMRLRHSSRDPDQITGYAVALPGNTTASDAPIFHSGGKLAADLSLPRLRTRWNPDTSLATARRSAARLNPPFAEVYGRAAHLAGRAPTAPRGSGGYPLRATARLITQLGRARTNRDLDHALALVAAMARFADTLAELSQALQRHHQAEAARTAATTLRTADLTTSPPPPAPAAKPAVRLDFQPLGRRRSR